MYDLRVLNQAWYIACDQCVEEIGDRSKITNEEAFRFILGRCFRDAKELLEVAGVEVSRMDDVDAW
jgi:hypothetical protein